jgi:hypothetical protein
MAAAFGAATLVAPVPLFAAQDWRTLDASRQLADTQPARVYIEYGAGRLTLGGARPGMLYDMHLRFDAERTEARADWDAASHTLRVGTRKGSPHFSSSTQAGAMDLALTRAVPLDLSFALGAVEAALDLSAIPVRSLDFATGASESTIRFDSVARVPLDRFDLRMGAAAVRVYGLGNARLGRLEATGGVGDLLLDFGGTWSRDATVDLSLAIGSATIRVPSDVGIHIERRARFLNALDVEGIAQKGDVWESPNFAAATYKLRMDLTTVLGKVKVERR